MLKVKISALLSVYEREKCIQDIRLPQCLRCRSREWADFFYGDRTPDLLYSALAEGRDIDPNFVSWLEKPWALWTFLHKLIGNMVFLWFIPPITDRVLLPLDQVNRLISQIRLAKVDSGWANHPSGNWQWWAIAMKSSLYFSALIFLWRSKGHFLFQRSADFFNTLLNAGQKWSDPNETFNFFHKVDTLKMKWLITPTTAIWINWICALPTDFIDPLLFVD